MSSFLNVATCCGSKGSFPAGTGIPGNEYQSDFVEAVIVPKYGPSDSANPIVWGSVKDGYSLQSSSTANTGIEWKYTGANGKTIQTYSFPNNCPIPFPSPDELKTDLVLITRESAIVGDTGLVDLYMPVVGIQGQIPTHSIPSVADYTSQVVFFFDDANAAINVYNIGTKTWRMGWVRGVPTFDFKWRAADLLTPDKVRTQNGTYQAPYNAKGIFFSCNTTQFTNSTSNTVSLGNNQPGLYFINYDVVDEEIDAWAPASFHRPTEGISTDTVQDYFVSAICVVNQKENIYYNQGSVTSGTPNPAFITKQFVAAIAVSPTSSLTANKYGWWGFLALNDSNTYVLVNPDMSWASGPGKISPYPNFAMYQTVSSEDVPRGYVQTISVDPTLHVFFIGGNFSYLRFSNAIVQRDYVANDGTYPQIGAVALQFKFSRYNINGGVRPLKENYQFIGTNAALLADCRDWSGRITQSNWADECFAYGGNFRTPPSKIIETAINGLDVQTTDYIATAPSIDNGIVTPYGNMFVSVRVQGGYLDSLKILFQNDGTPFLSDGSINGLNNICLAVAPSNGDLRQSTFPPVIISGNYLNPRYYYTVSEAVFQTQNTVIGNDWWFSYIEIYCEADTEELTYRGYLYPDNVFNKLDAPIQWHGKRKFTKGLNLIPILGGGTKLTPSLGTSGGQYLNSNLNATGTAALDGTPRAYFLTLIFTDANDNPGDFIRIGANGANLKRWPGCWRLLGYPNNNITPNNNPGFFSSVALQNNYAQQTASGSRRILEYSNVAEAIPQSFFTYLVFPIPINWQKDKAIYAAYDIDGTVYANYGIVQATFKEDRQGDFDSSVMNLVAVPDTTYYITNMNSSDSVLPAFSLYMNSKYEIYKGGWSLTERVALGVFTNFQEISDLQITVMPNGTDVAGVNNAGKAAFTTSGHTVLLINRYTTIGAPLNYTGTLAVGDTIFIQELAGTNRGYYQVSGTVTQPDPPTSYVANVPVTFVSGYDSWGGASPPAGTQTLFNYVLSRNPRQTPFVLQDDFGPYMIGNGSDPDTLRDVYLSPYEPTGKAYRYVPNWQNSFLEFDHNTETVVAVGAPVVDDTILCDTITFNSNSSSVLLSRSSGIIGSQSSFWNLVSTSGNIGFNNQSTT
jgi:hypothetical protein